MIFSAPPGLSLPPNPTLFLFSPRHGVKDVQPTVEAKGPRGERLTVDMIEVSQTEAYTVYRLAVKTGQARSVALRAAQTDLPGLDVRATYAIRPSVPTSRTLPRATIRKAKSNVFRWRCSEQRSRDIEVNAQGDVYRVEWAATESLYRAGKRSFAFLPADVTQFFSRLEAPAEKTHGETRTLPLGQVSCLGSTFQWHGRAIYMGVAVMRADGSVAPAPVIPQRIEPPREDETMPL